MASSQIEIASSSPFGCVLRDRNHRDGCSREVSKVKATHAAFQRNIKNFVMDHLNTCMTMSSDSTTNENNNTNNPNNNNQPQMNNNNNASSWVSITAKNNLARLRFTRSNYNNKDDDKDKDKDKEKGESFLASLISPRHSRLLDRWAAKQAREMVSTLENEAELLAIDNTATTNNNNNNDNMECSSEIPNLGASSLVQIWEKRLNKSNGSKPNTPVERTSPNAGAFATSNNENVFVIVEEQRGLEAGECNFEGPLSSSLSGNEETFTDWESDKTAQSSDQSRWCSSESDRVSVADIIKKLTTATNQTQSPTPSFGDDNDHEGCGSSSVAGSPCRDFTSENSDQKAFPQLTCSPRIRGRQAFNDLLMQLENDRHGELKNLAERGSVSRFTQRGRIQALLRLRLLQRGVAANDPSRQKSTSFEVNRQVQPHGSAIMQLREIFNTGVEQRSTVQAEVANTRSPRREIVNNTTQLVNSPTTDQLSKDTSRQIAHGTANHSTESIQTSVSHTREEDHPSSDVTLRFEAQNDDSTEAAEATASMTDSNLNEREENVDTSNQHCAVAESSYVEAVNEEEASSQQYAETSSDDAVEEEASNQNYAESSYEEMVEELEAIDQNYDESNYDWISDISRPRSYWEERRQAWYREMLDTGSQKEDIRELLQRKTVSTFLSSDFREIMDRLMESHRGTQTHLVSSQDDEEDNQGLIAFLQERVHAGSTTREDEIERGEEDRVIQEEEEEEEKADEQEHEEEQEGESLISGLYHEVGDYSNQSLSWSFRDNEASDDPDRVASTSSQPYQSQPFYHDSRRNSSSTNHHSIEMELIYDMRGHMEQLYHEMAELRKSIKTCMDMQMQLQQSMNQGVHTVKKEEKKSHNKGPKKGNCCICYEMKADSLLYRCGHMCTCLKCANELQWNSGKCPICRAKIVDVVRVYVDA